MTQTQSVPPAMPSKPPGQPVSAAKPPTTETGKHVPGHSGTAAAGAAANGRGWNGVTGFENCIIRHARSRSGHVTSL